MQNEQTGELNAQIFVNSTAETVQNSESNDKLLLNYKSYIKISSKISSQHKPRRRHIRLI